MNIKGGHMITLNPTASIIWQQLSEGRSPEEIAIRLANDFGISRERALADVNELVQQLEAQHLLDSSDAGNSRRKPEPWLKGLVCNLFGGRDLRTSNRSATK
jgi:hypothetical protein